MLIDERRFHQWATQPGGAYPHHVALRQMESSREWREILDLCESQLGRPATHQVEEGFPGTIKVYQEHQWAYTRLDSGHLYFEQASYAAWAKLSWG